jgi:hypothetical protein
MLEYWILDDKILSIDVCDVWMMHLWFKILYIDVWDVGIMDFRPHDSKHRRLKCLNDAFVVQDSKHRRLWWRNDEPLRLRSEAVWCLETWKFVPFQKRKKCYVFLWNTLAFPTEVDKLCKVKISTLDISGARRTVLALQSISSIEILVLEQVRLHWSCK